MFVCAQLFYYFRNPQDQQDGAGKRKIDVFGGDLAGSDVHRVAGLGADVVADQIADLGLLGNFKFVHHLHGEVVDLPRDGFWVPPGLLLLHLRWDKYPDGVENCSGVSKRG